MLPGAPKPQKPSSTQMMDGGVSRRSHKLMKGPLPYLDAFLKAMPDMYHPTTNTAGWIPLVVAENKLGNHLVLDRMAQITEFPPWVMNYGGFKGSMQLQSAFAGLLNRTFVPEPVLQPDNFCILGGCTGVLENTFYCLGDDGDSVLIPAPFYPAFVNDLEAKANLIPLPFYLEESNVNAQFTKLAADAAEREHPVRAVLLTNPSNPLGTIYDNSVVRDMLRWCLTNSVHYISDEIYALSVFKSAVNGSPPFISALTVAQELVAAGEFTQAQVDLYVHLVYGLSKDWYVLERNGCIACMCLPTSSINNKRTHYSVIFLR